MFMLNKISESESESESHNRCFPISIFFFKVWCHALYLSDK